MEVKGKFIIAHDTICDGLQTALDEDGKPTLYDSEADAMYELFGDAIAGLEGTTDEYFEDCGLDKEKTLSEMKEILKEGDSEKIRNYIQANPNANYYDEFIESAETFVLGRKTILTGQGIVIEGKKLEDI